MKEVIYNFLKCLSKVGLFFKRLAVKIRSYRRFVKLVMSYNNVFQAMEDQKLFDLIEYILFDLKE